MELVPWCRKEGWWKLIDNQTKEELINRILKEKDIKKSQTYKMTSIEPVKSKTNDEMNGYIHQTDVLEFDGQEGTDFLASS